jgi:hypothetical protein
MIKHHDFFSLLLVKLKEALVISTNPEMLIFWDKGSINLKLSAPHSYSLGLFP